MTKKQMMRDRQSLLDEIAALQTENLRLRLEHSAREEPLPPAGATVIVEDMLTPLSEFSRFPLLRAVDETHTMDEARERPESAGQSALTLPQVADTMRKYAAAHFGIYAERALYAHFLGAMAASGFVLLRGEDNAHSPLLLCQAAAASLGAAVEVTTVEPHWTAADLLGAPDPATKHYRETAFLRTLYAAGYEENACFAALDRVTAAPPGYLSGLLPALTLAQVDSSALRTTQGLGRGIPLAGAAWPGDPVLLRDGALPYPDNLWLLGVVEPGDPRPDERLRAAAMEFCLPALPAKAFLATLTNPMALTGAALRGLFTHAHKTCALPGEALELYGRTERHLADRMDLSLSAAAQAQLRRFGSVCAACGLRPTEALDGFFYHKALRRLESANPDVLKYELPGLRRWLAENFSARELPLTMKYLTSLEK